MLYFIDFVLSKVLHVIKRSLQLIVFEESV
jgi:hypothetical protein